MSSTEVNGSEQGSDKLVAALEHELSKLIMDDNHSANPARAMLWEFLANSWYEVGSGHLESPGKTLATLSGLMSYIPEEAIQQKYEKDDLFRDMVFIYQALETATEALEFLTTSVNLTPKAITDAERLVLEALHERSDSFLRRGDIFDAIAGKHKKHPSRVRVGQILAEFFTRGLALRLFGTGRGAKSVAYYKISNIGKLLHEDICPHGSDRPIFEVNREAEQPKHTSSDEHDSLTNILEILERVHKRTNDLTKNVGPRPLLAKHKTASEMRPKAYQVAQNAKWNTNIKKNISALEVL